MLPLLPLALERGDRVAIVSPAGPLRAQQSLDRGLARLRAWGLHPVVAKHAKDHHGYLAGTDSNRARDLQHAFADPAIRGILCVRGGYGCMRILDRLDFSPLKKDPKPILGYSDVTALLAAVHRETGIVGFHGPMVATSTAMAMGAKCSSQQRQLLTDPHRPAAFPTDSDRHAHVLREGRAQGPLVGGNLSLVVSLIGTPWEIDTSGALLFLEDIEEEPYSIDRMLTQLRLGGFLDRAAGLLFGDLHQKDTPLGSTQAEVVRVLEDRCAGLKCPVAYGMPFGHQPRSWTLPYGALARLDARDKRSPARLELAGPTVRAK